MRESKSPSTYNPEVETFRGGGGSTMSMNLERSPYCKQMQATV